MSLASSALKHLSPRDRYLFQKYGVGPSRSVPFACLHHAFEYHARITPSAIAVEHFSALESITYGELDIAANKLAHRLRGLGVYPGKRVCILAHRSIPYVIAILAVLKAGGQYVPLDGVTVTDLTLAHVLEDSGALFTLAMEDYVHRVGDFPVLCLEQVINEDEVYYGKPLDLATGDDGIYVIYTSGTTGKPKGVDVRHRGITNFLLQAPGNVGMRPGLRVAQLLNIAFDMGAWEILGSMANGCTLCLRGNNQAGWRRVLETVDIVISTPSILSRHDPLDYPNIKHVITGGEPCPQELADRWGRCTNFNNCCGPTEISIANTVQAHTPGYSLSIGTPVPNTNVYVLDEDCRPLPIGKTGSMWVGGVGVSRGYLNLPDKTEERYRRDPFVNNGDMMFNTGDLGRWRSDGQLDHMGRADDQVKVKGFRVELDGVMAAMQTSPEVDLAVCLLVETELWAFITPSSASSELVRADTSRIQPYYAVPTRYLPLDDLPQTSNGKVDKRALRRMAEEIIADEACPSSPATSFSSLSSLPATPQMDWSDSVPSSPKDFFLATPQLESTPVFQVGLEKSRRFSQAEAGLV